MFKIYMTKVLTCSKSTKPFNMHNDGIINHTFWDASPNFLLSTTIENTCIEIKNSSQQKNKCMKLFTSFFCLNLHYPVTSFTKYWVIYYGEFFLLGNMKAILLQPEATFERYSSTNYKNK